MKLAFDTHTHTHLVFMKKWMACNTKTTCTERIESKCEKLKGTGDKRHTERERKRARDVSIFIRMCVRQVKECVVRWIEFKLDLSEASRYDEQKTCTQY